MTTVFASLRQVRRDWYVVDARPNAPALATQLAMRLRRASTSPSTRPTSDTGDHIVGAQCPQDPRHGQQAHRQDLLLAPPARSAAFKSRSLEKMLAEHPERALEFAVKGMLPKNPLGPCHVPQLHVFWGDKHPHTAQQPKPLEL